MRPILASWMQFAFNHFLREIDEDVQNMKISFFQRNLEGLHVQPVACQDAAMISPARIRRRPAAPRVCAIDHIVVDQRGAVEQFDYGGQFDGAAAADLLPGCIAVTEQQQRGPQALPSPAEQDSL